MRFLILLLLVLTGTSCGSVRRQMDRAMTYEHAGMLAQAYYQYERLHQRKPRSAEAHVGMKRTAQAQFNAMQNEVSSLYLAHDWSGAESKRLEAATFKTRMDRKGLDLQWDPMLDTRRGEARELEARKLLERAESAFRAGRFAEAEEQAALSIKLEPSLKEAEYLHKLAQLEPRYLEGRRAMELGLWRDAYRRIKWVTDRDAGYKDAWDLLATCRERASYTLAYVPLYNNAIYVNDLGTALGNSPVEAQLAATVKQAILNLNDPFLVLVDRDNTDQLLAEQRRQLSGVYDDRYSAEAGRLLGARFVLTAKLLRFDDVLFKVCEVQMQLLDTETGRIHASEVVRVNKQELDKGAPRAQLLERASKRIAARMVDFDPVK